VTVGVTVSVGVAVAVTVGVTLSVAVAVGVRATGLSGADDPIWIPDIGLLFSEPNADRIVRLSDAGTVLPFITGLHRPLGMTFDGRGRLISLQSEAGFTSVRVVWPPGKEAILAERFEGLPFSRPNGVTVDRKGGVYFSDPGLTPAQEEQLRKTLAGLEEPE